MIGSENHRSERPTCSKTCQLGNICLHHGTKATNTKTPHSATRPHYFGMMTGTRAFCDYACQNRSFKPRADVDAPTLALTRPRTYPNTYRPTAIARFEFKSLPVAYARVSERRTTLFCPSQPPRPFGTRSPRLTVTYYHARTWLREHLKPHPHNPPRRRGTPLQRKQARGERPTEFFVIVSCL